jgi:hypothetical protein
MASSLIEPIARVGFAARGVVYVVVGVLAARAALGRGGRATDAQGAVREVGRFDAGGVLLLALALGLAAYAVWRIAQAFLDLDGKGGDIKGLAVRAGFIGSAVVHAGLALTAAGFGVTSGSGSARTWVARTLAQPWGVYAVYVAGASVVASGLYQFYKAWSVKFEKRLRVSAMSPGARTWSRRIGRFGLAARGVTFLIVGWFLLRAAMNVSAREVKDMAGALRLLAQQEFGHVLLGIMAGGLISYGLLSFVNARYRRIVP